MSTERLNPEERIGQILDDAQALINFCETSLSKPSRAWYACLVASAILTVDLEIPLDVFLEGFEHAFEDAEKARVGGQSYDH
jgi:hypothetical protein